MTKIVIFDIDNTLTESRSVIAPSMAALLSRLLETVPVALISGASMESMMRQVIRQVPNAENGRLYALPTSGAEMRSFERGAWRASYSFPVGDAERRALFAGLSRVTGVPISSLGHFIDDRGTQITYSGLGKDASLELKYAWDPTRSKRKAIIEALAPRVSGLSMASGGSTSIDFTRQGIDKAFGVSRLLAHLSIAPSEATFIGDALDDGGNDAPVKSLGVVTVKTSSLAETEGLIRALIK
jgi:hypothetical protein